MPADIRIAGREIGTSAPPFVVAEMSGNHGGSLERALALVEAAAAAGADALKLQTYTADSITLDHPAPEFRIDDPASLWHGRSLHELYREAHTPWEWHAPLFARGRELGLLVFSSPFDPEAVLRLEGLGAPCYKIASFELVDLPLVRCAAETGKPLILSTGMATVAEIDEAVRAARGAGCGELVLLACTSSYPADASQANLARIPHLASLFDCPVGLSDHSAGLGVAVAAVAHGAVLIEKHFTLDRSDGAVDSAFSLEPAELASLAVEVRRAWNARGSVRYGPTAGEAASLRFRRSLYFVADLAAGETVRSHHLRSIRPANGLAPKHLEAVLGRRTAVAVTRGTPLSWDLLA